jgi:hypothetical protein
MVMTDEELALFANNVSREWIAAFAPIATAIERTAMQTAAQLTQYSRAMMDAANTYKPFRRERERYLRRRRQTRATFHGR